MRRLTLSLFAVSLLTLSACGSVVTTYQLAFRNPEDPRNEQLQQAVIRVIDGRLQAQKKRLRNHELEERDARTTVLTLSVSDAEAAELLRQQLPQPFEMRIMKKVGEGEGDIKNERYGEFKETGITEKHFDWVEVTSAGPEGKGSVILRFTDEGKRLLRQIFEQNRGQTIGIFLRGQLMSQKLVDATDTQDSIAIDNIPSTQIANIFADDVNVGLHLTFVPVP